MTASQTRHARGRELLDTAYGAAATDQTLAFLRDISPDYADYLVEACFADVYGRPALSQARREVVNVIALTAMGGVDAQLAHHVQAALRLGVSPTELVETFFHLALIVGHPKANVGLAALKAIQDAATASTDTDTDADPAS